MQKKVLVVDDEESIQLLLTDLLEEQGYAVTVASDGQTGLSQAKEILPDVIVLDLMLPKMHGSAIKAALRANEVTRSIPIIFLSGMVSREDSETMDNQLSGDYLLSKPFNDAELFDLLKKILGDK